MKRVLLLLLLFSFAGSRPASALVNYDKGSRAVLGVQLLQYSAEPTAYYYLPQFPPLVRQQAATLLWHSLTSPTSDVSVAIHSYYEAAVEGYNAKITADVSTVYQHFSSTTNVQQDYTKTQLRNAVDNLQRDGTLKIEVLDRTAGLGIKAD